MHAAAMCRGVATTLTLLLIVMLSGCRTLMGSATIPTGPYAISLDPHANCCVGVAATVVWLDVDGIEYAVSGWEISTAGAPARASGLHFSIRRPKVVSLGTQHFIAWTQEPVPDERSVYGRFHAAGTLSPWPGVAIRVSDPAYPLEYPGWFDMDYLASADVILVAWSTPGFGLAKRLAYQLVDGTTGDLIGGARLYDDPMFTDPSYPTPSVEAGTDRFLVTVGGAALFIGADGDVIETVSMPGTQYPVAAFDRDRGRFLIAYHDDDRNAVRGRFISEAGDLEAAVLTLVPPRVFGTLMLGNNYSPLLAFSEARDQYALGHYGINSDSAWRNSLYTQLFTADGAAIGSYTRRGNTHKVQGGGEMTTAGNRFAVVYQEAATESTASGGFRLDRDDVRVYYDAFAD